MAKPFIWNALILDGADQQTKILNIVEDAQGVYPFQKPNGNSSEGVEFKSAICSLIA